ncbi:hypothetical protein [Streptomyces fuscichromogenes]|uniref:hypothetical protein n=1 Tax=Streptomyces fuscichromogenes TaxID=1324013 RepID=UPI00166FF243|nr:hypothetical protein [Streptomyces fuscichromogenes]
MHASTLAAAEQETRRVRPPQPPLRDRIELLLVELEDLSPCLSLDLVPDRSGTPSWPA